MLFRTAEKYDELGISDIFTQCLSDVGNIHEELFVVEGDFM